VNKLCPLCDKTHEHSHFSYEIRLYTEIKDKEYAIMVQNRDLSTKQLEVAMRTLEKYSFLKNWNEYTYYDGEYAGSKLAEITLAEINKIRGMNE
jgi:hypothetical protein